METWPFTMCFELTMAIIHGYIKFPGGNRWWFVDGRLEVTYPTLYGTLGWSIHDMQIPHEAIILWYYRQSSSQEVFAEMTVYHGVIDPLITKLWQWTTTKTTACIQGWIWHSQCVWLQQKNLWSTFPQLKWVGFDERKSRTRWKHETQSSNVEYHIGCIWWSQETCSSPWFLTAWIMDPKVFGGILN